MCGVLPFLTGAGFSLFFVDLITSVNISMAQFNIERHRAVIYCLI